MKRKVKKLHTLCIAALALSFANSDNSEFADNRDCLQGNRRVAKRSTRKRFSSEIERNLSAGNQYSRTLEHLDAVQKIWKAGQPRPESEQDSHYPRRDECMEENENTFRQAYRNSVRNAVRYAGLGEATDLCTAEIEDDASWNKSDAQDKYYNLIG